MDHKTVDSFEKVVGQLQSLHDELTILTKKSPSDGVSTFKLKFINAVLRAAHDLIGESYHPFNDFSEFDADAVPTNSDVVFMFGQYLHCCEKFRADNIKLKSGYWYWDTGHDLTARTTPPKKLSEK